MELVTAVFFDLLAFPLLNSPAAGPFSRPSVEVLTRYGPVVWWARCFNKGEYDMSVRKGMKRYPMISRALAEQEVHLYLFSPTDYLASQTVERKLAGPQEDELKGDVGLGVEPCGHDVARPALQLAVEPGTFGSTLLSRTQRLARLSCLAGLAASHHLLPRRREAPGGRMGRHPDPRRRLPLSDDPRRHRRPGQRPARRHQVPVTAPGLRAAWARTFRRYNQRGGAGDRVCT